MGKDRYINGFPMGNSVVRNELEFEFSLGSGPFFFYCFFYIFLILCANEEKVCRINVEFSSR